MPSIWSEVTHNFSGLLPSVFSFSKPPWRACRVQSMKYSPASADLSKEQYNVVWAPSTHVFPNSENIISIVVLNMWPNPISWNTRPENIMEYWMKPFRENFIVEAHVTKRKQRQKPKLSKVLKQISHKQNNCNVDALGLVHLSLALSRTIEKIRPHFRFRYSLCTWKGNWYGEANLIVINGVEILNLPNDASLFLFLLVPDAGSRPWWANLSWQTSGWESRRDRFVKVCFVRSAGGVKSSHHISSHCGNQIWKY